MSVSGPVTIDASVFLNAFNEGEEGHETSLAALEQIREQAIPIICPTLLLPEVSATISRGTNDAELAKAFAQTLEQLPHMLLVPLDMPMMNQATTLAAEQKLRGSDAVYIATAFRYASTIITNDLQMRERSGSVPSLFPRELLNP